MFGLLVLIGLYLVIGFLTNVLCQVIFGENYDLEMLALWLWPVYWLYVFWLIFKAFSKKD